MDNVQRVRPNLLVSVENTIAMFDIGSGRFLTVSASNGVKSVHIRQYACDEKSGFKYPTRMGVSLPVKRFASLVYKMDYINHVIEKLEKGETANYKSHVGGGLYVIVDDKNNYVDLRMCFVPDQETLVVPTQFGISLEFDEWKKLVESVPRLMENDEEISSVTPCFLDDDHSDLSQTKECSECTPFGTDFLD